MSGVERLWALIGSAGAVVLLAVMAVRVYQSDALTWTVVLGILGIAAAMALAQVYDRRIQYLRRQQDLENETRARLVQVTSILRALATANVAGGTGGAATWQDSVRYLLRDATAEDMADSLPTVAGELSPGHAYGAE